MEIQGFQAGENAMENGEAISSLVNDQSIFVVHMDEAGLMTITTRGDPAGWPDGLPKALGTLLKAAGHSLCIMAETPPQAVPEPVQEYPQATIDAMRDDLVDMFPSSVNLSDQGIVEVLRDLDDQDTFTSIIEAEENDEIRREIDAEEEGVR